MAPREVSSVTPFLYAFKRWFTFSGRTSALPDILTTAQRYEQFLKYAIGKSLFVIHPAVSKYLIVIHNRFFFQLLMLHRGARAPTKDRAKRENFLSCTPFLNCIDTIGISLRINRDFPTLLSILFCTFVVEKERDTYCETL